jgi:diacylglycerol kinase family enzyme
MPILQQQLRRLPLVVPAAADAAAALAPGWCTWHDALPMFALVNPPFIAASSKLNPWGGLHRGHFNMLMLDVPQGIMGRLQAVDLLSKAETGAHITSPYMRQHAVRAMLFEPRDSGTYLQLDGELVPSAPLYVEVHPGLIRVIVSPAHPDEPAADASRHHFARRAASPQAAA